MMTYGFRVRGSIPRIYIYIYIYTRGHCPYLHNNRTAATSISLSTYCRRIRGFILNI